VRFNASGRVSLETQTQWQPNDGTAATPVRVGRAEEDMRNHRASLEARRELPGIANRISRRILRELALVTDEAGNVTDSTAAAGLVTTWRGIAAATNAHAASLFDAAADQLELSLNEAPAP
jgi:hypothetical protein